MNKPYDPSIDLRELKEMMKKYRKVSYNRFRWWRWLDVNNKLNPKSPLLDRIKNGDFDNFVYYIQLIYCEHELNRIWEECKGDIIKYNELSIKMNLRRQKLLEDYWKNDDKNLKDLAKSLSKHFKIEIEILNSFMEKFDGSTEDLYHYIDENRIQFKNNLIKFIDGI